MDNEALNSGQIQLLLEQQRRRRTVAVALPAVVGGLLLVAAQTMPMLSDRLGLIDEAVPLTAVLSLAGSVAVALMWYLQTGFKRATEEEEATRKSAEIDRATRDLAQAAAAAQERTIMLQDQLAEMRRELEAVRTRANTEPGVNVQAYADELMARVREEAADGLMQEIEQKLATASNRNALRAIDVIFSSNHGRLHAETEALSRRGNLNLVLGSSTTVLGLILLAFFVLYDNSYPNEPVAFALHFAPRVALILFIQAFAYFFLKLYKSSLEEIKYFQNEITNIQQKQVALSSAIHIGKGNIVEEVISVISRTERNHSDEGAAKEQVEHDRSMIQAVGEVVKNVTSVLPGRG